MTAIKCPECGSPDLTRIEESREDGARSYKCSKDHIFSLSKKERQAIVNPDCVTNTIDSEPSPGKLRPCKICNRNNILPDRKFPICVDCFMTKLVQAPTLRYFKASLL